MTRKTYFPETGKVQSSLNPQKTIYFSLFLRENGAEAHTSKSKNVVYNIRSFLKYVFHTLPLLYNIPFMVPNTYNDLIYQTCKKIKYKFQDQDHSKPMKCECNEWIKQRQITLIKSQIKNV